jgi:hypothetical protein
MSNADQNPLDIHQRFAALKRRAAKLESGLQEVDRVVAPERWIGEVFESPSSGTCGKPCPGKAGRDRSGKRRDGVCQ